MIYVTSGRNRQYRANQLRGRFLGSDAQEEKLPATNHEHNDLSYNMKSSLGPSLLFKYLMEILKYIRFLTVAHPAVEKPTTDTTNNDYRATCLRIQHQLETLYLKTIVASLEKYCMYAASSYIDQVLFNTPGKKLIPSKLNGNFQGLMLQSPEEADGNEDILRWISGTAAGSISTSSINHINAKASLIDKFNRALAQLEARAARYDVDIGP
jgi:hypothetical protein